MQLFIRKRKHKVSCKSGLIGIVNPARYNSFVHTTWDFERLKSRFIDEMNNCSLVIWGTGYQSSSTIVVLDKPSSHKEFQLFEKVIDVTNGELHFTNYEDFSTVSQLKEGKLPLEHRKSNIIKLKNGRYKVTVRNMLNPEAKDKADAYYEVIFTPTETGKPEANTGIIWYD